MVVRWYIKWALSEIIYRGTLEWLWQFSYVISCIVLAAVCDAQFLCWVYSNWHPILLPGSLKLSGFMLEVLSWAPHTPSQQAQQCLTVHLGGPEAPPQSPFGWWRRRPHEWQLSRRTPWGCCRSDSSVQNGHPPREPPSHAVESHHLELWPWQRRGGRG